MNYVFGGMIREFEYKGVTAKQADLERIEEISDALVEFESYSEVITDIDYDVEPEACKIYVRFPELIIRGFSDPTIYEVIEMADKFELKQVKGEEEAEVCLTLTVNI